MTPAANFWSFKLAQWLRPIVSMVIELDHSVHVFHNSCEIIIIWFYLCRGSCLFALALSWPVCFSGQDPLRVAQLSQPETKGTWWWYQTWQPCPGCLLPLRCRTSVPTALSDAWGSTILDLTILLHHVPNSDLNLSSATCYKIIDNYADNKLIKNAQYNNITNS